MAASTALQVLVSPFLGTLFDNLSSLIQSELSLIWGVSKDLEKLSNTLSTIRDVLEDAEVKQITDKALRNWLQKLKDAAYDAEDILDECATEALTPEPELIRRNRCSIPVITDCVSSCFGFRRKQRFYFKLNNQHFDIKKIRFGRKIAQRIQSLREKFDEIAEERSKFHLNLNLIVKDVESRVNHRETTSFLVEPQVYGRDEDKEYLVNLLLSTNVEGGDRQGGDVFICPILGMGGLGKTTLAQMVLKDERIIKNFEVKCWVCVSEDFNLKKLLNDIIVSCGETAYDRNNLDHLQHCLQEMLANRKFLLVLDDVWNEDQAKWYRLKSSLTCGSKGSSILVTTRLETVASMMGTLPTCRPGVLSKEHCWSLFKHRAFNVGCVEEHPKLEAIGKEIVKKCGGIPLAAKALGGLLRFKREENEWLFVRDSEIWDLPQDKEDAILPALRLSYNHLPSHLRPCFAYCSIFPKDYEMKKEILIHFWVANGFVQPKRNMELEDIGNEIFNDLLWRSLLQDVNEDIDGKVVCKMHDLVHDLACSITGNECRSIVEVNKHMIVNRISITRHLSTSDDLFSSLLLLSSSSPTDTLPKAQPLLRTFLQLDHMSLKQVPPQFSVSEFKCLRMLDLSVTDLTTLPVSIGNLIHLRYLDLSQTLIISLPNKTFCKLRNLQTLKLYRCEILRKLPKNLKLVSNLRHLDISGCYKLTQMPIGMGELKSLQTLSFFIVGKEIGRGIEELQGLDHLRGELTINGLENVRNLVESKNANLMRKQNLHSLELCWSIDSQFKVEEDDKVIAEGLQPHPNMKRLRIQYYRGLKFPSWMKSISCICNLVEVILENCRRCKHLPPLGLLPHLKVLKLSGMFSLECIDDEFNYGEDSDTMRNGILVFPSLKELVLSRMSNLKSLGKGLEHLTTLNTLTISNCALLDISPDDFQHLINLQVLVVRELPKMTSLPAVGSQSLAGTLEYVDIKYCPSLTTLPVWIANHRSLESLKISDCENLEFLPEGLQHLTALQTLSVIHCHPDLHKRCQENSNDHRKLSHIPNLINIAPLPDGREYSRCEVVFEGCSVNVVAVLSRIEQTMGTTTIETRRFLGGSSNAGLAISSKEAERLAVLQGVKWAIRQGFDQFMIEGDALAIINFLKYGTGEN